MTNTLRDLPSGEERVERLAIILQQLVRGLLGQNGNGIPITATKHTGTAAANVFSSADTTNGIGLDASSQNGSYRVVIRNSSMTVTGAPTFSAMTQGSVLFAGASGLLSQDNGNLNWNDSTDLLTAKNVTVTTKAGVGGATGTETLVVTGTTQITQRLGVGGAPDATIAAKITGAITVTTNATLGTSSGDTITLNGVLVANETATFNGNMILGNAAADTITVNGTPNFAENVTMVKDLIVDTTTFKVDATNNRVGVLTASPAGTFDCAGYARVSGNTGTAATGEGVELSYGGSTGAIGAFNRGAGTYSTLVLYGDPVQVGDNTGRKVGFYGSTGSTKQTVTGAKGGNVALANLMTALANLGIVTDSTT